jgi:hypothetical protein
MSKLNKTPRTTTTPFKGDDFNSDDGMLTTIWGPGMWHSLHTISFNYPVKPTTKDKIRYKQFILNLQYILPCGKCRNNLKKNFKKLPLKTTDMKSRETFSLYIYRLHELINRMLHKSSGLSYEDVRERYEHFRSRCTLSLDEMITTKSRIMKKEDGCTEPLYGEKAKCVINIVPQAKKCKTFNIHKKCIKRNLTKKKNV